MLITHLTRYSQSVKTAVVRYRPSAIHNMLQYNTSNIVRRDDYANNQQIRQRRSIIEYRIQSIDLNFVLQFYRNKQQ